MGLLDGFLGKKGDETAVGGRASYSIGTTFQPVRMGAHSSGPVDLLITLKNTGDGPALTSVLVELPPVIGFDNVGAAKAKEVRVGMLKPGDAKGARVTLVGNSQTPPGNYRIALTISSHYRDYDHIVESFKKMVELRVV
jgi:hypothetical protein